MTDDPGGERSLSSLSRAFTHRTSLATRLSAAALAVSLLSLVGLLILSSGTVSEGADELADRRLHQVAAAKAVEVESQFRLLGTRLSLLATSPTASESIQEFTRAFDELNGTDSSVTAAQRSSLRSFYFEDFIPALSAVRGSAIDAGELVGGASPAAFYLQAEYIAENPLPAADRRLFPAADDGSEWSAVHAERHPFWQGTAERMGFADLYLIEPETRTIVYSVSKQVDFATSLETGPYSGTELAIVTGLIALDPREGDVLFSDLATFTPALDQPSMFVAAPVFDGGRYAGLVVARVDGSAIDQVMTREWRAGRFGDTGEAYLVGSDSRMRSVSRAFLEDRGGYLDTVDELGIDPADRRGMIAHGTTALFQEVTTPVVDSAGDGSDEAIEAIGYLGTEVIGVAEPISAPGFDWALVVEQATSEVEAPIAQFFRVSLIIMGVFVVALTFLMVAWANRFIQPVRDLSATLDTIRRGSLDLEIPSRGTAEFRRLSAGFASMMGQLRERRNQLLRTRAEKTELLGLVLPTTAAESVERGDRRLLQTTPAVSVAVIVLDGLDDLVRGRTVEENRDLVHRMLDAADSTADAHGVTRIKVMGDSYFGACGLEVPYLDHAPRAVAFAQRTREAVRAIARETGLPLDVRAGIHSGPVTVGLVGDSRLVYDLWGDTVADAYRIARLAQPGQILVSGMTHDRLPPGTEARAGDDGGAITVWEIVGSVASAEAPR